MCVILSVYKEVWHFVCRCTFYGTSFYLEFNLFVVIYLNTVDYAMCDGIKAPA